MFYYQKDNFKLWLDENRKSDSVEPGNINKDKLYQELREMAKEMAFEMMDRGQNSAKSNK